MDDGYVECCGEKFKRSYQVRDHALWHTKPELFNCSICLFRSQSIYGFKQHAEHHGSNTKYGTHKVKCIDCGKWCFGIMNLSLHMQTHQTEDG